MTIKDITVPKEAEELDYDEIFDTLESMRVAVSPDPTENGIRSLHEKIAKCREYANEADGFHAKITNIQRKILTKYLLRS